MGLTFIFMKILITGATGFVGSALCRHLMSLNHDVVALGRRESFPFGESDSGTCRYIRANTMLPGGWQSEIGNADVIVNLAGESILQRWSAYKRSRMWKSRVYTTRNLLTHVHPGQALVNISATGFYGDCGAMILDEGMPAGTGFLSDLCQAWENEALRAMEKGIRVVIARLGVVLGNGGALEKMLPVFRLGMGGRLGSGHQWMPWIHMNDVTAALVMMVENPAISGIYNLVAPTPLTNRAFTESLGRIVNRPTLAPVPRMVLNIIFGEASRVMLDSQRAHPVALLEKGFAFQFGRIDAALSSLVAE